MARQRVTLTGTLAADAYRSLADLFGFLGTQAVIVEGVIQTQVNGATVRTLPRGSPAPATADAGLSLAAGAGIGSGPIHALDAGIRLDETWVRNTTVGANATVVFFGVLEA